MESLPGYKECFVCGKENPLGLQITLFKDKNEVKAEFVPDTRHQGFKGIVHGGILFSILDEMMGRTAEVTKGVMALTIEIKIKYRRKAPLGQKIIFTAKMTKDWGRMIEAQAQACLEDGTLLTEAQGKFLLVPPEMQREIEEYLEK